MATYLTEEQIRTLQEVLRGHHLEAIITLALATGMRRDELLQLQWEAINLEKCELRVRTTKTNGSDRMIPLAEHVAEVLKQHRQCQMDARMEAGAAWQDHDLV